MMRNFTKSLFLVLAALFSYSFAYAETGTEGNPSSSTKNAQLDGQSYFIAGDFIPSGAGKKVGTMENAGLKLRTNQKSNTLTFTVNENYTIKKLVLDGYANDAGNDASLPGIKVSKVVVDDVETAFEGGEFPVSTESTSAKFTLDNIAAQKTITLTFDNSNVTKTSQIVVSWTVDWERPDATQPTITVSPKAFNLVLGATYKMGVKVDPASFTTVWFSNDEAIAKVAENGTVTAIAAGSAKIINRWTDDEKVADTAVVTVSDFSAANYAVAKKYDFTNLGDVTLTTSEESCGKIWNYANKVANDVFFCTNEGLENIAVQAVGAATGKGWSIVAGKGLFEGSGAGRCAAIGNLTAGQIVEIIYTGEGFYTDASKDDGATKTTLSEGVGRAIYKMEEDGMLGFELIAGNAVKSVTIYSGEASDVRKEAVTLASDLDAVAVGKLIAAINEAELTGDESKLQAAIDQFKADNADQISDQTAKVATNGWKKYDGSNAGTCATQFAPAIDTYDGRKGVQLAEVYETTVQTTGTIIYQDITGLANGKYRVGFYGNAFFTSGRGFDSEMEDGSNDVAYVFANDQKEFITARIATSTSENNFRQFDVEVTDGTIKLGMGKEKAGTNWHTMQIYQLTWFTTAKEVFAAKQKELKAVLAEANALLADETKTEGRAGFEFIVQAAELGVDNNTINIPELEAIIGNMKSAVADFKKANYYLYAGNAYIIDAESGKFMAAGHDWGTRGIVNELGLDLTFVCDSVKRTVTIDTKVANGDNHFLGSNLYMDGAAAEWALEYRGFGFYITNGTQYINIDAEDNLVMSDTPREWIIVTAEGVMAQRLEEMAEATAEKPVDATFLIQGANFNRGDQRNNAWNVSADCTNKNLSGGNQVNNCAESFHSTFTISQVIKNAPKGVYKLTAQGFYRQDGDSIETVPVFFINDSTAQIPVKTGSENSMSDASASFTNGLYTIDSLEYVLDADSLLIGVKNETAKNQWIIFDNFRLTYYGPAAEEGTKVTFDFADANFREKIGTAMADVNGFIYNETFTADGATLQITGGSAPSRIYVDANRGQNLVTYKEYTTLTFNAPEGKAISKIEFTAAGNSNIKNFVASSGAINDMIWTGNAEGVRFAQGGTSYLANAILTLVDKTAETAALPAIEYTKCANIAEFNKLAAGTYAEVTLTDAEVIGKSADGFSTVWVQDATGGCWIQYTSLNDQLKESTKVNGTVYVVARPNSGNVQMKEAEATLQSKLEATAIEAYTVVEGTIAELNVAANLNKVVKISADSLVMTSATAGKLYIGQTSIDVNNGKADANQQLFKIADWEKGKKIENITIEAILVGKSTTENQLLPIAITENPAPQPVIEDGVYDLTSDMFKKWESHEATEGQALGCNVVLFEPTGLPYGDGNVFWLNYANLTPYDKLVVTVEQGAPRFCFNRIEDNAQDNDDPATAKFIDIPGHSWGTEAYETVDENGYRFIIDLKKMTAERGFAHLHAIKGANWADVKCSAIKLVKGDVELPTSGISTVKFNTNLNGTIYNLNGQKMEKAQKGLYIINGKKVVVK